MRKKKIILVGIVLILMGSLLLSCKPSVEPEISTQSGELIKTTKYSEGEVFLELTPKRYVKGKFYLDMGVNTHNVDDLHKYDLQKITTLKFKGKEFKPNSVFKMRGHHNYGDLVFATNEKPDNFVITITNLHDQKVRRLSWP